MRATQLAAAQLMHTDSYYILELVNLQTLLNPNNTAEQRRTRI